MFRRWDDGAIAASFSVSKISLLRVFPLSIWGGLLVTTIALVLSALIFGAFVMSLGADPLGVYATIYKAAFGSWFSWQNTLSRAAPLILAALCVALPARLGLVIIGGEGAIMLGGLAAAVAGIHLSGLPAILGIPILLVAGTVMGGLWIGFCGVLRCYRGVNETISSLLLVYLAVTIFDHLVDGPLRDLSNVNFPSTHPIDDTFKIGNLPGTDMHWGLVVGCLACLAAALFMRFTPQGFAMRIAGGNPRVALSLGLPVGRMVIAVCLVGGAAAGLAGALEVAAVQGRASGALHAGYGYMGILVAFLARHNPLAVIPAAILTGGIAASSGLLQRVYDLPDATAIVLQGIVFLLILACETLYGRIGALFRRFIPNLVI